ncbi:hypothetical protein [Marimonas arenosa]|uniref:DUF998 domain-containing protein n=1 Tax=Marimonas arenosa TaxID=1795305 RepID=A0AAE3WG26_9RHOB|nr:hypothetical protein [Marimonas arenosa]MDQ2092082.1 hypothetical protein [Marimonas arenosa]
MRVSDPSVPTVALPALLRIVGLTAATFGLCGVALATLIYVQGHEFSLFTTYLSDIGNTPTWPMVTFNTMMLMVAPIRYGFLVLLVMSFMAMGGGRAINVALLLIGVPVVIGSAGMSAFPASRDLALHEGSAMIYFFGTVVLQGLVGLQEIRLRLPRALAISSLAVVVIYLVFAVLLALVGQVDGVTRSTPVIWEWMAFAALMVWLILHSLMLGRR